MRSHYARNLIGAVARTASEAPRAEALVRLRPPSAGRITTWRDYLGRQPAQGVRYEPRSREELAAVIGDCAGKGIPIRAVGGGFSSSAVARPEGAWIDIRSLNRVLPLTGLRRGTPPSLYMRVEAGMLVEDLHQHLRSRGFALPIADNSGRQTLAGAISTGTHGSSLHYGPMADSVVSVELVVLESEGGRPVSRIIRLEPTNGITCPNRFASDRDHTMILIQNDELFYGSVVGLGATGVVCAYTLAVQPQASPESETRSWMMPWSSLYYELSVLAREYAYIDVVLYPHPTGSRAAASCRDECIPCHITVSNDPIGMGAGRRGGAESTVASRDGGSIQRLRLGNWGRGSAIELSVPVEDASQAVAALLDEAESMRREGWTPAGPVTIRFQGASAHALSMSHGRETCSIEIAMPSGMRRGNSGQVGEDDMAFVTGRVQAAVEAVVPSARPHWGMMHELSGADFSLRYPDAPAWRKACRAFDPRGYFLNAMTSAFFRKTSSIPPSSR